jgi:hypothetical protein
MKITVQMISMKLCSQTWSRPISVIDGGRSS